jgi:hypothetical protein
MNKQKTGFWRGFTRKRFIVYSLIFIAAFIAVEIVENLIESPHQVFSSFTLRLLIKILLRSLLFGFLLAVWFEPGVDTEKTEKIPQA